ncbi:MAG: hypothetical protein HYT94_01640 [Parcubacteria group bacterium]|nr:hypothetical protein [Parcubacteria group bacterium]
MENITPSFPGGSQEKKVKKEKYIISVVVFILAILVAYLAWSVNKAPEAAPEQAPVLAPIAKEAPPMPETEPSLGGDIYEQTQNPVKDKIPESVAPVSNPIGGAYKNPFE